MYVTERDKVPKGNHYAIVEFDSITIPGDERSRTNPGHGYPEHSESVVRYVAFTDRAKWEEEIKQSLTPRFGTVKTNWIAIKATPATVKATFNVEIQE